MPYRFTDRYLAPMQSLLDSWPIKSLVAALGVLFQFDGTLLTLVVVLITIDVVTGMRAAHRRGERISSLGMRKTIPKVLEFGLFIVTITAVARAFPIELGWADHWAIMYVAATEVKSIVENLWPKEAAGIMAKLNMLRRDDSDKEEKPDGE